MKIEVSEVISRPPEVVFQFVGFEHVAAHSRWDTKLELAADPTRLAASPG